MASLAKTGLLSKLIFFPMAAVSTLFTIKLFYDFGAEVFTGILWGIVGLSVEASKLFFLARWQNAVFLKKKIKLTNPAMYVSCALLSAVASMVFGISTIERQAVSVEGTTSAKIEMTMRLRDAEQRLANYKSEDPEAERRAIDKQIEAMTAQITNLTVNISERSIQLTEAIQKLQDRRRAVGRASDATKEALIAEIGRLKRESASLSAGMAKTKASFETLAGALGVSQDSVMIVFLLFIVLAIEVCMALTSGPAVASGMAMLETKKPTKPGKPPSPQIYFEGIERKK